MTLKRAVQLMYVVSFLIASAAALVAGLANINHYSRMESERLQLESLRLADELRQSSDDLTRFVRTYVATADPKYEQYYRDVLAIRNGQKPRPEHYDRIYWDFVAAGRPRPAGTRTVPLQQLMRESGFTGDELDKLGEAQNNSDALVRREEIAMQAMKGLYADGTGAFSRRGPVDQALAIRLVHDAAYHDQKARIMQPINEVLAMVDQRTASALSTYNRRAGIYWHLVQTLVGAFLVLLVISYPMVRRRVFVPVSALQHQTEAVATDLDRMAVTARQIARGNLEQSFTATATPLDSASRDEVGELSRLHDAMIGRLQETAAAIATMTAELSEANKALKNENAERRRAEMEAAEAQHRIHDAHAELLATLDVVPAALVIMNADRSIRLQNRAAEHLLGTVPESSRERRQYFERFSVHDRTGRPMTLDELPPVRALSGAAIVGEEVEVERPDGRKATILVGAAPVRDGFGHVTGAVAGFQDISRLRELDRIKDEFVAIVSHEMRTPLTAILGSLQLLVAEDAVSDPDNRELLIVGLRSCERLVRIVNDMLDISKMEAGRLNLRLDSLDVGALVQQAVQSVETVAGEAGVTVVRNVDAGLPAVHGDRDRLTQALVNLLSNAIKFAPPGSAVTVSASDRGDLVEMSVTDRGPGIAPSDFGRLFQKFQQLDGSGTRRVGGTGLGLSITKAIVEEHGGTIKVDSIVGQGATFTFTVPREPIARQPAPSVSHAIAVDTAASVRSVLIVENDSRAREELLRAFEAAGLKALEATSGGDAIDQTRRHHPDAIVISLNARDSDGHLVADTLSQDPEIAQIPVVITSGAPPEGGTDAALEQPIDPSELVARVEQALPGWGHATVLVADDEDGVRLVVRRTLERHGFRVIEATDGNEALSLATTEAVDLVVLDLKMPNLHGYDVIRALRRREATAQLPIIVLSGSVGARHSLESLILGANAFLPKPADPDSLVREIRRLVGAGRSE